MNSELSADRMSGRVAGLGDLVLDLLGRFGDFAILAGQTVRAAVQPRFPALETLRQMEAIGTRSVTIVLLTALFTGMVMALQTGIALARFGAGLCNVNGVLQLDPSSGLLHGGANLGFFDAQNACGIGEIGRWRTNSGTQVTDRDAKLLGRGS